LECSLLELDAWPDTIAELRRRGAFDAPHQPSYIFAHVRAPVTIRDLGLLLLLTLGAIAIHGYHYGVEDQAAYLPAIKKVMDPALFPHDAEFFLAQTRWTIFDEFVGGLVRLTRAPTEWTAFFLHIVAVFLVLLGCLRVARRCFREGAAQWGGVALVASLLTIPVAGTLVIMVDSYLHPRVIANGLALVALADLLDRKWRALAWLVIAAAFHPQATAFAAAHGIVMLWRLPKPDAAVMAGFAAPLWLQSDSAWRELMLSRQHHFPLQWTWYEWLGAVGPALLLAWFSRIARQAQNAVLEHVSARLALSCALGTLGAVIMNVVPPLTRFMPMQPMRHLHFVYLLLFLLMGGLIAQKMLRQRSALRAGWLLLIVAVMFFTQRYTFSPSPHLELPGVNPRNEWLDACAWIRQNTPPNALFALDPLYMEQSGVDQHSFRALAERSMMADYTKDRGVAAIFPSLAERWKREVDARRDWRVFRREDFLRLRAEFGVDWIVVERKRIIEQQALLNFPCPYSNSIVLVCRVE
jgi:hypothetical protein